MSKNQVLRKIFIDTYISSKLTVHNYVKDAQKLFIVKIRTALLGLPVF